MKECACPFPGPGNEYKCDDAQGTPFPSHCHCDCHKDKVSIVTAHACQMCIMIAQINAQEQEQARFYSEMNRIGVRVF